MSISRAMPKKLQGEEIDLILSEYDGLKLGDVFDVAQKQEQRGNSGLALKIYEYAVDRFGVMKSDGPYERAMGSIMYTAMGKLYMQKEDFAQAEAALGKAAEHNSANHEALYWEGEICARKGFIQNAMAIFSQLAEQEIDVQVKRMAEERLEDLTKRHRTN